MRQLDSEDKPDGNTKHPSRILRWLGHILIDLLSHLIFYVLCILVGAWSVIIVYLQDRFSCILTGVLWIASMAIVIVCMRRGRLVAANQPSPDPKREFKDKLFDSQTGKLRQTIAAVDREPTPQPIMAALRSTVALCQSVQPKKVLLVNFGIGFPWKNPASEQAKLIGWVLSKLGEATRKKAAHAVCVYKEDITKHRSAIASLKEWTGCAHICVDLAELERDAYAKDYLSQLLMLFLFDNLGVEIWKCKGDARCKKLTIRFVDTNDREIEYNRNARAVVEIIDQKRSSSLTAILVGTLTTGS